MTLWQFYFGWYQGAVYSNLLASAICTALAAGVTVWRVRVHHERTRAENAAHRKAVEAALAEYREGAREHRDATAAISDRVAALHARLDQQSGGEA